jgi:mono/diheme cytochrome c family protein
MDSLTSVYRFLLEVLIKMSFIRMAAFASAALSFVLQAQTDPGPRGGTAGAGGAYPTLNQYEMAYFTQAVARFQVIDSVIGTQPGTGGGGLGPTFNGNSCAQCHAQPAVGGSSPGFASKQNPGPNPQVALATLYGATNSVPSFITLNGPVREARFISDGGVHGLFTIQGRTDAKGCTLAQPDFATAMANNNVIFRIPTPVFGLGLVENTPDLTLEANLAANQSAKTALGISGSFNTSGNDGTITRFGWKAQNKSLLIFSGEAYNVEMGVSNEGFPNERSAVPGCVFNPTPEDGTNIVIPGTTNSVGTASAMSSDIVNFAAFARMSAPPAPAPTANATSPQNGQALFVSVGCALCHSPSLTTGASPYTGMGGVTYHPYSDFALHHMGSGLADGITQGSAGPDQFRTAPLWGLGQRLFFLHDGRTSDLLAAIEAHTGTSLSCSTPPPSASSANGARCGAEANGVISAFQALRTSQKQDILNFLRTL